MRPITELTGNRFSRPPLALSSARVKQGISVLRQSRYHCA